MLQLLPAKIQIWKLTRLQIWQFQSLCTWTCPKTFFSTFRWSQILLGVLSSIVSTISGCRHHKTTRLTKRHFWTATTPTTLSRRRTRERQIDTKTFSSRRESATFSYEATMISWLVVIMFSILYHEPVPLDQTFRAVNEVSWCVFQSDNSTVYHG